MSSTLKNLSITHDLELKNAFRHKIGIVTAHWNHDITHALWQGCVDELLAQGIQKNNIVNKSVPGSFELIYGAKQMSKQKDLSAIICLGCIIQGETPHFDFIAQAVANGLAQLNIELDIPVVFGVITTLNMQQALDRAGGKHGNKGIEAAYTAISLVNTYL